MTKEVVIRTIPWKDDFHKSVHDVLYLTARATIIGLIDKGIQHVFDNIYTYFDLVLRIRQSCCNGELVPMEIRMVAQEVSRELADCSTFDINTAKGEALLQKMLNSLKGKADVNGKKACLLCCNESKVQNIVILRRCQHEICKTCLAEAESERTTRCPICREPYGPKDVVKTAKTQKWSQKVQNQSKRVIDLTGVGVMAFKLLTVPHENSMMKPSIKKQGQTVCIIDLTEDGEMARKEHVMPNENHKMQQIEQNKSN